MYYFCFARSFQAILKRLLSQKVPVDQHGNKVEKDLAKIRLVWLPIPDNINTSGMSMTESYEVGIGSEEDISYWESLGISESVSY